MALLEKAGLSFDLHANWHQLIDAATFFASYPDLTVVVVRARARVAACCWCYSHGERTAYRGHALLPCAAVAFLSIVQDHLGCPFVGEASFSIAAWRAGIKALAANPRVYMKASGFGAAQPTWLDGDEGAFAVCQSLFDEVVEAFGVDRVMFASNFPVDMLLTGGKGMGDHYAGYKRLAAGLSEGDRDKLFRLNARAVYKIDTTL